MLPAKEQTLQTFLGFCYLSFLQLWGRSTGLFKCHGKSIGTNTLSHSHSASKLNIYVFWLGWEHFCWIAMCKILDVNHVSWVQSAGLILSPYGPMWSKGLWTEIICCFWSFFCCGFIFLNLASRPVYTSIVLLGIRKACQNVSACNFLLRLDSIRWLPAASASFSVFLQHTGSGLEVSHRPRLSLNCMIFGRDASAALLRCIAV